MPWKYPSDTHKRFVSTQIQLIFNTLKSWHYLFGKDQQAEVNSWFLPLTAAGGGEESPACAMVKVVGLVQQSYFWSLFHCSSVSTNTASN